MLREKRHSHILAFVLIACVILSYMIHPSFSKYTNTYSGIASHTWFTTKIVSDLFRITNDSLVDENGVVLNEITSQSLHGVGITEVNGVPTVGNVGWDVTSENDLQSLSSKVFVVQNDSEYDLVACFDIILCMGLFSNVTVSCTITEKESGTKLDVVATRNGSGDITLKLHKESENDKDGELPIIVVDFGGLFGIDYNAYSFQVDPSTFIGTKLTEKEFEDFLLVKSGTVKNFELSTSADGADFGSLDRNCYASMTMTTKKYIPKT